jgi:hypothetical protein
VVATSKHAAQAEAPLEGVSAGSIGQFPEHTWTSVQIAASFLYRGSTLRSCPNRPRTTVPAVGYEYDRRRQTDCIPEFLTLVCCILLTDLQSSRVALWSRLQDHLHSGAKTPSPILDTLIYTTNFEWTQARCQMNAWVVVAPKSFIVILRSLDTKK